MRKDSSLTESQRAAAVGLFEEGYGSHSVATHLRVSRRAVGRLFDRWRLRGGDALVGLPMNRAFPFEIKREVVRRFLAGETKVALAQEFGVASPATVAAWVRIYRREGEDGLRPKPKGRPPRDPEAPAPELTELERLQQENEYLRVKVAYLEKLKALRAQEQQ